MKDEDDKVIPFAQFKRQAEEVTTTAQYGCFICPACETDGFGYDIEMKRNSQGIPYIIGIICLHCREVFDVRLGRIV